MKNYLIPVSWLTAVFVLCSSCNLFIAEDKSGDYFTRIGDNNFVDSIFLKFQKNPNKLFEIGSEYMINSSFDRFYSSYLKEIGKMGVLLDKKPRLYISKFNYTLTDDLKNEILTNPSKYPSSFINTLKNSLPLYLFITSYDVNYSEGNKFEDAGFKKGQIGKSWGMANYGGGKGKIFSINFMYVDNSNSSDKQFKLSSYNTGNKHFGFVEIGKVSSQYSGVLEAENNGELRSPSFNYMKYEYSFHLNNKVSKDFNREHFDNSENFLITKLFSENNQFKTIDQLIENCEYTFYAEHIEIRKVIG